MAFVRRLGARSARLVRAMSGSGERRAEAEGWPRCVVSGLQPTGELHVGNYFGALRQCVRAQDRGEDVVLFVADLHALTAANAAPGLHERSVGTARLALACGVDPGRSVLFVQSAVPRHAELCWVLGCLTSPERLSHLPQYGERGGGLGVLLYPVLQAADVLLYRGTHVPAGEDQVPHLQLAAQLARAFNRRHGRAFPEPRVWPPEDDSARIRSLRAPDRKMSKSDPDPKSRVLLTDSDDAIRRKLRKAVTDFTPRITFEPERRPGVSNLVRLHCLATDRLPEEVVEEYDALNTAQYKEVVAEALIAALSPIRSRAAWLESRPQLVREALQQGAARARARADAVWARAASLAGLTTALPDHRLLQPCDSHTAPGHTFIIISLLPVIPQRYMAQNPIFAAGDFTTPQGAATHQGQWMQLKDALDELGPYRTVEQWKTSLVKKMQSNDNLKIDLLSKILPKKSQPSRSSSEDEEDD